MDHVWTNVHGWISVDNVHGWATCRQFVTGGAHFDGRDSLGIDYPIRNRITKLYGVRVDSCGERGSKTTVLHILSTCLRVTIWLSCVYRRSRI